MSMPPMSLKTRTGSFLRPCQVTAAKYSLATAARSSTSTPRGFCPLISSARIARAAASAAAGVSANLTPPAFMRPPVSTCDFEDDRDGEVAGDLRGLGGGACDTAPEERRVVAGEE